MLLSTYGQHVWVRVVDAGTGTGTGTGTDRGRIDLMQRLVSMLGPQSASQIPMELIVEWMDFTGEQKRRAVKVLFSLPNDCWDQRPALEPR